MSYNQNMNTESGNVFFYILLAIALFAALSYAVSQGNRGNTSTLTDQQAKLAANEIIEYGQNVANAVQKLKLRGCADTEISFENDVLSTVAYANSNSPTDKSCHVFEIAGGGISYKNISDDYIDSSLPSPGRWYITGGLRILDLGSSNSELTFLGLHLKKDVCNQINTLLGLDLSSISETVTSTTGSAAIYNGQANDFNLWTTPDIGDEATELAGKTSFCFENTTLANSYIYVQTLMVR